MSALKPSPNAVETANRPAASCVNRKPLIARHCRIELQNAVSTPPIRSDSQPQPWRLKKPMPSSTDSMVAPTVAEIPRSLQYATRCCCGIDMVTQHRKPASAIMTNTTLGCQPSTSAARRPRRRRRLVLDLGRRPQKDDRQRHDDGELQDRKADHRPAPAEIRDRALEDRRPDESREIAAARNQRERRAAAPVEPAADIDEQRRIEPGVAEHAHEQAVAEIELPRRAERRNEQADGDHHRAGDHRPADAVAVGEPAHQQPADGAAEQRQRHRERRHLPRAAGVGGDLLQSDRGDPRPAERQAEQDQRNAGDDPGGARLDRARVDACAWVTTQFERGGYVRGQASSRRIGVARPGRIRRLGPGEFEVLLCTERQGGNK